MRFVGELSSSSNSSNERSAEDAEDGDNEDGLRARAGLISFFRKDGRRGPSCEGVFSGEIGCRNAAGDVGVS